MVRSALLEAVDEFFISQFYGKTFNLQTIRDLFLQIFLFLFDDFVIT